MRVSPPDHVRAFYDENAEAYNIIMDAEIDLPMYAEALGKLAARIAAIGGAVLDTSCGSGHMLERFRRYAPERRLLGVDLSPRMVAIARERLDDAATIMQGDMRTLDWVADDSCAAVLSFFALHHVDPVSMGLGFLEWHRVLVAGGQLLVATWEGEGIVDYGDQGDIVARRYRANEVSETVQAAGFRIDQCKVQAIEGMEMNAVFLTATKVGTR